MALPNEPHPLSEAQVTCHTASVGGSPVAAHCRAPFRGRIIKTWSILGGAITSADAVVTVATNNTGSFATVTGGTITIANTSSAAGDYDEADPTAANLVNEGDVIRFTPASASGSSIPCTFGAVIRRA